MVDWVKEVKAQVPPNFRDIMGVSSPVPLLTISSGSPRMSLFKMLDDPVEARFRLTTSPGKVKIAKFDKAYFYYHRDTIDLQNESNAEIVEIKTAVGNYMKEHNKYVPEDILSPRSYI